jgi:hypothetical protein
VARSLAALAVHAQHALKLTQAGIGDLVGCSERTVQRWANGGPASYYVVRLVPHVFPVDPRLADELAHAIGETLESLGVVKPAPPAAPRPAALLLADTIACAGADAGELAPSVVRRILLAAFKRAREVGASLEDVETALEARVRPARSRR